MLSNTRHRVRTHRRRRMSNEQWDLVRPIFKSIYYDQGKPLLEVKKMIEESHDFEASEKTWKDKIKAWGLMKNRARATPLLQSGIAPRKKLATQEHIANSKAHSHIVNDYQPPTSDVSLNSPSSVTVRDTPLTAHCLGCTCLEPRQGKELNWHEFSLGGLKALLDTGLDPKCDEEYIEAVATCRKAHSGLEYLLGPTNETTLGIVSRITSLCYEVYVWCNKEVGIALARESQTVLVSTVAKLNIEYGTANAITLKYSECLARNLQLQERWGESEVILDHIIAGYRQLYKDNPREKFDKLVEPVLLIVEALESQQKIDRTEEVLLETVKQGKAIPLDDQHQQVLLIRSRLLRFYAMGYGKADDAEEFFSDSLKIFENMEFRPFWADFVLPTILRRKILSNNLGQSQPVLELAEAALKKLPINNLRYRALSHTLAGAYVLLDKFQEAKRCLANCPVTYEDRDKAVSTRILLGCIYHYCSRWDDAVYMFERASRRCNEARLKNKRDEFLHGRIRDSLRQANQRQPLSKQELDQIIREMLSFDNMESFLD